MKKFKKFKCTYRITDGSIETESFDAEGQEELVNLLTAKNYLILSIAEEFVDKSKKKVGRKKIKQDEILIFVRQLATMIDAGVPLLQCLQSLQDQLEPESSFYTVLHTIVQKVSGGASISDAFSTFPKTFDNLFVSMVRAGEAGGFLPEILNKLAVHLEQSAALKRKVKSAMMYPMIVITIAVLIVTLLIVKVIPVFENMFKDFGAELPMPTQVLINISHFVRSYGVFLLVALVGFFFFFRWYLNTTNGRLTFDGLMLKLPVVGPLIKKVAVARFSSTLAALIGSGVTIINALEIVSTTSGNEVINKVLKNAVTSTERGEPIAAALNDSPYIPRMVVKMMEIGESSGRLDTMLDKISDFYTDQINAAVAGLTSMIEPIMIAFLGIVVGGIMIAMFMPIFTLSNVVS